MAAGCLLGIAVDQSIYKRAFYLCDSIALELDAGGMRFIAGRR